MFGMLAHNSHTALASDVPNVTTGMLRHWGMLPPKIVEVTLMRPFHGNL